MKTENKNIPVFLICDDNYSPYMSVMIASICKNTEYFINFHVIGKEISYENKTKLETLKKNFSNFDIDYKIFDAAKVFNIPYLLMSRMTTSTYIRMALPDLYPELKRALIMDVDIISLKDIALLWEQNIEDYIFAATLDEPLEAYNIFKINMGIKKDFNYANCGVMIINCEKWRNENITEKCLDIEKRYRDKLLCADQDVINRVFLGNFKKLDSRYNSLLGNEKDIVNRHFCALRKPWFFKYSSEGELIKNFENWWEYAKMSPFYNEIKDKYDKMNAAQNIDEAKYAKEKYQQMTIISKIRNEFKKTNIAK